MAPSMNAKNSCIRFLYENITKFKINLKVYLRDTTPFASCSTGLIFSRIRRIIQSFRMNPYGDRINSVFCCLEPGLKLFIWKHSLS